MVYADSKQRCAREDLPGTPHEVVSAQSPFVGPVCPNYKPNHSPSERAHRNPIEFAGNVYGLESNGSEGVLGLLLGLAMGPKAKTVDEAYRLLRSAVRITEQELRSLRIYHQADLAEKMAPYIKGIHQLLNGNSERWSAKTAAENLMADSKIDPAAKNPFVSLLAKVSQAYDDYLVALAARNIKK